MADVNAKLAALASTNTAPVNQTEPAEPSPFAAFAPVYFPGVESAQDATPVTLATAEDREGVDFVFRPVTTATIAGTVSGPVADITATIVNLVSAGPASRVVSAPTVHVGPDGRFAFHGVLPGAYTVVARADPSEKAAPASPSGMRTMTIRSAEADAARTRGTNFLYAAAHVETHGENVDNVSLLLEAGGTLTGRVTAKPTRLEAPASFSGIQVSVAPASSPSPSMVVGNAISMTRDAEVQADGTFTVTGIGPGSYTLRALLPSAMSGLGWWPRSAMADGRDLLDEAVDVVPGGELKGVVLALSDVQTVLSGTMISAAGRPAPDYAIAVFSTNPSHWQALARRTQMVRPATDGAYVVRGLPPGDYYMSAVTTINPTQLTTPEFFRQLVPASIRISARRRRTEGAGPPGRYR